MFEKDKGMFLSESYTFPIGYPILCIPANVYMKVIVHGLSRVYLGI